MKKRFVPPVFVNTISYSLRVRAFTLAEVLLTLVIIGIVAAITIPAVVTKVTKDQYVTALKKAFNTLKQVEREAIRDHGEIEGWDWGDGSNDIAANIKLFDTYIVPYLDVLKNCKGDSSECLSTSYKYLTGEPNRLSFGKQHSVITSDGIAYASEMDGEGLTIYVDVNGKKGPNVYGRDLFMFYLFKGKFGIKPEGSYSFVWDGSADKFVPKYAGTAEMMEQCSTTGTSQGSYCSARVLSEGAMNY